MVACPFRALVVLHWALPMEIIEIEMINVWDTISTFIHLGKMLLSSDILFEQRIGQFTRELPYIRFAY